MARPFIDNALLERSLAALRSESEGAQLTDHLHRVMQATLELFGATGAGIMMIDEDSALAALAATDEAGRLLETRQQEHGQGPCVDALVLNRVVSTDDLALDARWPLLADELPSAGVRAILGVPVHVRGLPVGSLNVYRDRPESWSDNATGALKAYAGLIDGVLEAALLVHERERLADQLQRALDNRVVIERAVGATMGRLGVDAVTAFNELRSTARGSGRRVAEVAAEVLSAITTARIS